MTDTFSLIRLLRTWRRGNAQEQRETFQALQQAMPEHFTDSGESVSTPLGVVSPQRKVNLHPDVQEGVRRARTRQYAVKPKERNTL